MLHKQKVRSRDSTVSNLCEIDSFARNTKSFQVLCKKPPKFRVCFDFGDYKMFVVGAITKIAMKLL